MMRWLRHALHLDETDITDEDRQELKELREITDRATVRANKQAVESTRLAAYFKDQQDRNHIAERLNIAIRGR
jgi:hypothetical protein